MSIDLITKCRRRLDVSHGELLVAIELADAANDYGEGIMVGVARIADRSRQDERTVQRQLARLRELGWLQVVEEGGLRGGRGRATQYRINSAWVKGDTLPGFPDFVPKCDTKKKGDTVTPFPDKGCQTEGERVTKPPLKGDTAVSPDPLTHKPSDARARANPPGSRDTSETKSKIAKLPPAPPPFDEVETLALWRSRALGWLMSECRPLGITAARVDRLDELPTAVRLVMLDKIKPLVEQCVEWERPPAERSFRVIESHLQQEITLELRQFKPPTVAELAASNADLEQLVGGRCARGA